MLDTPAGPLLETKLYAPKWRPGLIPRPRLRERLDRGAESKLVLVSAPAGFGKTTLLAEWLASDPVDARPVAWLSLDENDNHPASFWTYLITALQTVQPGIGAGAIALQQSPQPPPIEILMAALLNEVGTIARDFVLVLDDYHQIDARPIHDGIAFLLDHMPASMHLVITSRADPPLPLARLRGRSELTEIRAADLRFAPAEAAAFINETMGLHLSAQNLAVLDARTEGWIAGLQLAALSMQGREDVSGFIAAFSGDDRYIVDYLIDEVLERQPAPLRRFLLQTSILERLTGPLCDAVTGEQDGRAALERLERGNVFVVRLDDRRQWYRYHHLFADVLQARLRDELPGEVGVLHRRASEWYEQDGQPADAIRHAQAAGDFELAAGLIEAAAKATLLRYEPALLLEWLRPLPDGLLQVRPVLSTYYAFALFGVGEIEAAAGRLRTAEQWLDGSGGGAGASSTGMVVVDEAGFQALPGLIALAHAYRAQAFGDLSATLEEAGRALELLPEDERLWRAGAAVLLALAYAGSGDLAAAQRAHDAALASLEQSGVLPLALAAACDGAALRVARGHLSEAGRFYERWLKLVADRGGQAVPGVADLLLGLSALYCERGDLDAAHRHLLRGEDLARQAALPETPSRRFIVQARLRQAEGDLAGALDLLDAAERVYVRSPVPEVWTVAAMKARLWLAQRRLGEAQDWVRERDLSPDDGLDYLCEFEHVTLARVLIAHGENTGEESAPRDAIGLLDRLLVEAEAQDRTASLIDILITLALAQRARGNTPAALEPLGRALSLAEPEGYLRTFIDEGEPMHDLLRHAVAAGAGDAYARRLLQAFDGPRSVAEAAVTDGLAEPLTTREIEIMRLIAAGMRNQDIAEHLVISPSTVKRHIANAYGKLDVSHRTEALLRARELNLL
jgi:LuxR family transcriptional regulator, maltose regulon positive regulatory protein